MVTKEQVMEVLYECYDPEIPVNIVDLGLIYDVSVEQDSALVTMTLTTPGCPMHSQISANVRESILKLEGLVDVEVKMVFDPRWTVEMITPAGREKLGLPQ
ncbi:MAG: metal-sulfur cluster assembly factor [Candidatus Marinimicrobia bacterium]|nr:metal-sulfur cluster assembly factor [Candidatus Neomarinimicrobiota bacterium]